MSESATALDRTLAGAERIRLDRRLCLVVIAPHPDDEVIGFGGAIFDHAAAGGPVIVVSVTDGEAFDPLANGEVRVASAARRSAEQQAALARLGIPADRLIRLGLPDGELVSLAAELEELLRNTLAALGRPGDLVVVSPWRDDGHPDHEATSHAVRSVLSGEILIEIPIWSWHHRTDQRPSWSEVAVVPISDAGREAKRAALRVHMSQIAPLPGHRPPILSERFLRDFDRAVEVTCR